MMIWFAKARAKLALLGASLAAVAAFVLRIKYLERKRDQAEIRAEILEARAVYARVKGDIKAKSKLEFLAKRKLNEQRIKDGLKEPLDNLSNPDNY
jgi:hypothetical protein